MPDIMMDSLSVFLQRGTLKKTFIQVHINQLFAVLDTVIGVLISSPALYARTFYHFDNAFCSCDAMMTLFRKKSSTEFWPSIMVRGIRVKKTFEGVASSNLLTMREKKLTSEQILWNNFFSSTLINQLKKSEHIAETF